MFVIFLSKIKTCTLRFPAKENLNVEKVLFNFSPERLLNQPKATRVCIRSLNQSNSSNSVGVLFRVLFARFHFKVIRKSLYKVYIYIYRSCYSFQGATSRYSNANIFLKWLSCLFASSDFEYHDGPVLL